MFPHRGFHLSKFSGGKRQKTKKKPRGVPWILACTCCLPSTPSLFAGYVTACTLLSLACCAQLYMQLKGACCHVVLHRGLSPSGSLHEHRISFVSWVFLHITPHIHMLLLYVHVVKVIILVCVWCWYTGTSTEAWKRFLSLLRPRTHNYKICYCSFT